MVNEARRRGANGILLSSNEQTLSTLAGLDAGDDKAWDDLLDVMERPGTYAEAPFVQLEAEMHQALIIHVLADDLQSVLTVQRYPAGPASLDAPVQQLVLWKRMYEPVLAGDLHELPPGATDVEQPADAGMAGKIKCILLEKLEKWKRTCREIKTKT